MTRIFNKHSQKDKRRVLRNNLPEPEIILWSCLKNKNVDGYKFRRQYSVGPYVLDFYCPISKLAIEVDGDSHFYTGARIYDMERQHFIESFGIQFLRFTNIEVRESLDAVLSRIKSMCGKRYTDSYPSSPPLIKGRKS